MKRTVRLSDGYGNDRVLEKTWGIFHPLGGSTVTNWIRLLWENGGFHYKHLPHAVTISATSIITSVPRLRFWLQWGLRMRRTRIDPPPLFVLGHWRSGTTLLYRLLCRDPALGYVRMWDTLAPKASISLDYLRPILTPGMPYRRPMDDMPTGMQWPYEEEAAMALLSPLSYFHSFYFPCHMDRHFRRAVLFEDVSDREVERWKRTYRSFLKAIYLDRGKKRLVLKNPANTARLRTLLEMFPEARFIHIYRNPYVVYPSTTLMRQAGLEGFSLQGRTVPRLGERVLTDYRLMMQRYFETRNLVPKGRLHEIRFEDLEADPLGQMEAAYDALGLEGFDAARPKMEAYVHSLRGYRKNRYTLDEETIGRIGSRWAFAIDRWGYDVPEELRG